MSFLRMKNPKQQIDWAIFQIVLRCMEQPLRVPTTAHIPRESEVEKEYEKMIR